MPYAAPTVRMNRDSLYSAAILDTSAGTVTITLTEGDPYQSVMMVDTESYARKFILEPGTHEAATDTEFVWLLVRAGPEKELGVAGRMESLVTVQSMGDET